MEKGQILFVILLVSMVVGLVVGVVFIARAIGLVGIAIYMNLFGIRFARVVTAQEGFIVGMITLLVGIVLAYVSLKILHVPRAYFMTAIFVSIELLATVAYIVSAGGSPDFSIWLAAMSASWWFYLYFIGAIED